MARPKRQEFESHLAEFRRKARLTQEQVAERLGATTESVSRHERGVVTPSSFLRRRYCDLYGATDVQLGFAVQSQLVMPQEAATDDVSEILDRVRTLTRVGDTELSCYELGVDDLVGRYESNGPVSTATAFRVTEVGGRGVGSGWRGPGVGGVGASSTS